MNLTSKFDFFHSSGNKEEGKFNFFGKDKTHEKVGQFQDHVNAVANENDKSPLKAAQERKIDRIIANFRKVSEGIDGIEEKPLTGKQFQSIQKNIKEIESEMDELKDTVNPQNQKMHETLAEINNEMKRIVIDVGLVNPGAGGIRLKDSSTKIIEDLRKENPNNKELNQLLDKYNALLLRLGTIKDPAPFAKSCREAVAKIVECVDENPALFDLDSKTLDQLIKLTNNVNGLIDGELLSKKIEVKDKLYPIDAVVGLCYVENKLSDPLLHAKKFVEKALSHPDLKEVKDAYLDVLEGIKAGDEVGLQDLQVALLAVSDKWQEHAGPLLEVKGRLETVFAESGVVDTKDYDKIHHIIAKVKADTGLLGNIKSYIATQVSDNSMISEILDKVAKKIGLSENVEMNNDAIAQKMDPARVFGKPYLAYGDHYDYGVNLDSVIDYQLDQVGKKIPGLKIVLGAIKEPLKALIKEKVGTLVEPEHFNAIVAGFLDDVTGILNQLATGKPPEGYELDIEEFAKQKYDIIADNLINILSKTNKSGEKSKWWQIHKKAAQAFVDNVQGLLLNEKVKSFLTKKLEKKVGKVMSKTASAVEKGVDKAVTKIEKKGKKIAKFEAITSYLEDNTRLDQVVEDVDKYSEQLIWDLTAKLIGRVRIELDKAEEAKVGGSRSTSPTKESEEAHKADITKSYHALTKSVQDYLLFGPTGLNKQVIYNLVGKYQTRIDPNVIARKVCESTTKWVHAEVPHRKKVEKIHKFDKGLLYLANKGYLDAKLEYGEDTIRKELARREGAAEGADTTSSAEDHNRAAFEHLSEALKQAEKPKDIKRALAALSDAYRHGIGVKKDEKMAEKFADQLAIYVNEE